MALGWYEPPPFLRLHRSRRWATMVAVMDGIPSPKGLSARRNWPTTTITVQDDAALGLGRLLVEVARRLSLARPWHARDRREGGRFRGRLKAAGRTTPTLVSCRTPHPASPHLIQWRQNSLMWARRLASSHGNTMERLIKRLITRRTVATCTCHGHGKSGRRVETSVGLVSEFQARRRGTHGQPSTTTRETPERLGHGKECPRYCARHVRLLSTGHSVRRIKESSSPRTLGRRPICTGDAWHFGALRASGSVGIVHVRVGKRFP